MSGKWESSSLKRGSSRKTGSPRPCTRTMFGGPWNAHHMRVIRPFSRRCATVSAVEPAKSRYATVSSSRIAKQPRSPLGERLTVPSPDRGAVAVKKRGCASMKERSRPYMRSYVFPMCSNYGWRPFACLRNSGVPSREDARGRPGRRSHGAATAPVTSLGERAGSQGVEALRLLRGTADGDRDAVDGRLPLVGQRAEDRVLD